MRQRLAIGIRDRFNVFNVGAIFGFRQWVLMLLIISLR